MQAKTIKVGLIAVALGIGAYWYWSPHLALNSMKSAALQRDADTFNEFVDYPKLRESLKGQFISKLTQADSQPDTDNEYASAGQALGNALGVIFAEKLVDAMVRPEVVMRALQGAKLQAEEESPAEVSSEVDAKRNKTEWEIERNGFDKVIIEPASSDRSNVEKISLVFQREGFASWKLTEIRIPDKRK